MQIPRSLENGPSWKSATGSPTLQPTEGVPHHRVLRRWIKLQLSDPNLQRTSAGTMYSTYRQAPSRAVGFVKQNLRTVRHPIGTHRVRSTRASLPGQVRPSKAEHVFRTRDAWFRRGTGSMPAPWLVRAGRYGAFSRHAPTTNYYVPT